MPAIYDYHFDVRYTECDPYGHVGNAHYLRYMQEAAFAGSAAAGYDYQRYRGMGVFWLVRETEIEYLIPLKYGDSVRIHTWVEDYRRSLSRRRYDIFRGTDDVLVARGSTDWVYIDSESLRPLRIPADMLQAFFPGGAPQEAPRRARFPEPPPPPAGVFRMRRRIEWRDIDLATHVNNAAYLAYIDDCGFQVMAAHGWPLARAREEGFGILAQKHRIHYRTPAEYGDEIEISTYVYNPRRVSSTRYYQITRPADGAVVLEAHTRYVWIDLETGKPIRVPQHFRADFAANVVGEWGK